MGLLSIWDPLSLESLLVANHFTLPGHTIQDVKVCGAFWCYASTAGWPKEVPRRTYHMPAELLTTTFHLFPRCWLLTSPPPMCPPILTCFVDSCPLSCALLLSHSLFCSSLNITSILFITTFSYLLRSYFLKIYVCVCVRVCVKKCMRFQN